MAATAEKRPLPPPGGGELVVSSKKPRCEGALSEISNAPGGGGVLIVPGGSVPRTSDLAAPIMKLMGHHGEVLAGRFSPCGSFLATSGFDKEIMLWTVFGECRNYCVLRSHQKAVLQLAWGVDSTSLYSCSADRTLCSWDAEYGERIGRMIGHTSHVNSVAAAREARGMIASGSDDKTARLWDARVRKAVLTVAQPFQCLAVELSADASRLFAGGLDHIVRVFDLRAGVDGQNIGESAALTLEGHADSVTGLRLSPDGTHLLSSAMDQTVRSWDVRPFVLSEGGRLEQTFVGAQQNYEKNLLRCAWSHDGSRVSAGSSDWNVYVWDVQSGRVQYKLPGHRGCVNEVDFHPTQPIIASMGSDKTVFLGEITEASS